MSKKFMQSRNYVHIFHVDLVLKLQFSLSKILIVVEIPCFHVNDSLVYSLHRCWDITFKSMIWCKKWDCVNYGFRLVDVKILDVGSDLLGYYFHFTWACGYCLFSLSLLWGFIICFGLWPLGYTWVYFAWVLLIGWGRYWRELWCTAHGRPNFLEEWNVEAVFKGIRP